MSGYGYKRDTRAYKKDKHEMFTNSYGSITCIRC